VKPSHARKPVRLKSAKLSPEFPFGKSIQRADAEHRATYEPSVVSHFRW